MEVDGPAGITTLVGKGMMKVKIGNSHFTISRIDENFIQVGEKIYHVDARQAEQGVFSLIIDGSSYQVSVSKSEEAYTVLIDHHVISVSPDESGPNDRGRRNGRKNGKSTVHSNIPGRIVGLKVKAGQKVQEGQGLMLIEAMKMENEILAPRDGIIKDVFVKVGDLVPTGQTLVALK